jgi:hypothetical protein
MYITTSEEKERKKKLSELSENCMENEIGKKRVKTKAPKENNQEQKNHQIK